MRRFWLLLGLAATLLLWLWQTRHPQNTPESGSAAARTAAEPGYVAVNAELIDTGEDGQPQYRLQAARIEQSAPGADVVLTAPQFQYQGPTSWTVTAQSGNLLAAAQRIDLSGDVLIVGTRVGADALRIRSSAVSVDLAQQQLDTSAAVAIEWGRNTLAGIGLHANMIHDSLRLESQVHGEFAR